MPLSYTALFVLQALSQGYRFGFDIMEVTALPSGTIYPALRRLEALELVSSDWEKDDKARKEGRPRRRYYQLTADGRRQLAEAEIRFRAVGRLFPKRSTTCSMRCGYFRCSFRRLSARVGVRNGWRCSIK
jgi:PadR family transcriptional regulator PadR